MPGAMAACGYRSNCPVALAGSTPPHLVSFHLVMVSIGDQLAFYQNSKWISRESGRLSRHFLLDTNVSEVLNYPSFQPGMNRHLGLDYWAMVRGCLGGNIGGKAFLPVA